MIVVLGSPVLRLGPGASSGEVAGMAGHVALAAAAAGRAVQVVGKVGDDDAGDALMVALTRGGVGHAALLRDAAHATAVRVAADPAEDDEDDAFADNDRDGSEALQAAPDGLPLEAADIELALRYLTEFQVLVIAAPLDLGLLHAALDAAGFAGAHVIRLDAPRAMGGDEPSAKEAPPDGVEVTAFEAPEHDEPAFAAMVGRYAAGLDTGRSARDAFADATRGTHWERAAGD